MKTGQCGKCFILNCDDWLVEIDGTIADELQSYKGVTHWHYI